jgi:hypothetical protein
MLKIMNRAIFCGILAVNILTAQTKTGTDSKAEVLKVETIFNEARLHGDTAALDRILAEEYLGFNHWGAKRNKLALIELCRTWRAGSLDAAHVTVRVFGDIAILDGMMNEANSAVPEKYIFMRTYVKRQGRWQLLTSSQSYVFDDDMKRLDPELVYYGRAN